jgi:tetratricopeptide (TPR) repeat protein
MPKIFISFRNGDEPFAASMIYRELGRAFGFDAVFRSTNSLRPGAKWAPEIWRALAESEIVVAVIGPHWLSIVDDSGRPRIRQRFDWVRREIAHALTTGKHLIPVLVGGAKRPAAQELPESLVKLANHQSVPLDHRNVAIGIDALVDGMRQLVPTLGSRPDPSLSPTLTSATAGRAVVWPATWRVPGRAATSVDRETALREVAELLCRDDRRAVVVLGGVGVGKTHLATELVYRHVGEYDHVWWVTAEGHQVVATQLTELGRHLGVPLGVNVLADISAIITAARRQGPILLVLDGINDPIVLRALLPALDAGARILVTARTRDWGALPVKRYELGGFTRAQSLELLAATSGPSGDLAPLAAALDDIPLAVSQASTFLASSGMPVQQYLRLLAAHTRDVLQRGDTVLYPTSLGAAWAVALSALRGDSATAAALVELLACAAPAPLPVQLLADAADRLALVLEPSPAEDAPSNVDASLLVADSLDAVNRSGLVAVVDGRLRPNALLQAFVAAEITPQRRERFTEALRELLAAAHRDDPRAGDPDGRYAELLPHALAASIVDGDDDAQRRLAVDLIAHLVAQADPRAALDLAMEAVRTWTNTLGPDAEQVLDALGHAAQACYFLGRYDEAASLDQQILARLRQSLGEDDRHTAAAAHNVSIDTWAAGGHGTSDRTGLEQAYRNRRRILGAADPDTLRSAHNLGLALRAAGDFAPAHELDQATLTGLRAALGPNHADTLRSAMAVGFDLIGLHRHADATVVLEDAYRRLRRLVGPDHPDTLRSGYGLAVALRGCGSARCVEVAYEVFQRRRDRLGHAHVDTLAAALLYATTAAVHSRSRADRAAAASLVGETSAGIAALGLTGQGQGRRGWLPQDHCGSTGS